ncbi:hypothetical protein [Micromonospora sp. 067-2]|uniref:hypothetical protein n=1 Tax=Micromonospora sp. 067-2 TaxID=2789270 RepID=UPI003977F6ED
MRKVMTFAVLTFVALAVPTAGMAVNVSSSDGSGTQTATTKYSNGAYLDGTLKSTSGNPVYYSGLVVLNNCGDVNDGRYTGNVTSQSGQGAGGTVSAPPPILPPCSLDGEKARVCRDKSGQPDPCGSWSALIPK